MKQPIFTGSGVAIITPFFDGTIDIPCLKRLLDFHLTNRTDAIIVCGTTGEASTMSYRERMRTIECCVEYIGGRIPVIAGTGSNSTENTRILSKDAQQAGADGLLLVTPYYNKATQQGLLRHYFSVADAVDIPMILYNVPSRTGVNILPETYAVLAQHPNIIGTKEASGNLGNIQNTRNLCPADFFIWAGNDDETVPICALGGVGVISVVANILPAQMHALTKLCLENNFSTAGTLQLKLKPLCDILFCEVNPIPVKAAMAMMGMASRDLRLPLTPLSTANEERLRKTLQAFDLLPDK